MVATLEGDLTFRRHGDGRVEILQAPPRTRFSLELIATADSAVFRVSGRRILIADQVAYEVTGWDALSSALVADLVEDRRG